MFHCYVSLLEGRLHVIFVWASEVKGEKLLSRYIFHRLGGIGHQHEHLAAHLKKMQLPRLRQIGASPQVEVVRNKEYVVFL